MRQKPGTAKPTAESMVKDIRRRTRKHHSAEEKIRIVLEGLRGEDSIAELCRREGTVVSGMLLKIPGGSSERLMDWFFRRRGQGALLRGAERGFPSRRPCASGSGRKPAALRAASARSRRRATRSGS